MFPIIKSDQKFCQENIGGDNIQDTAQKCLCSERQLAKSVSEQLKKE